MTQEKWRAVYGNATEQFKDKAQHTINKMDKLPPQRFKLLPAWAALALVMVMAGLILQMPLVRDKTIKPAQEAFTPLAQAPFEQVTPEKTDILEQAFGITLSDKAKALIDTQAIFPAIQTEYAGVVVEQAFWDGCYAFFEVMVKPKSGYYFVPYSDVKATQDTAQQPLGLIVTNADKNERDLISQYEYTQGVARCWYVTSLDYYEETWVDVVLDMGIYGYNGETGNIERLSQDSVTVKVQLMEKAMQDDTTYRDYFYFLQKGAVEGTSVEVLTTPITTYVTLHFYNREYH